MKKLNALYAQSGGVTSVINATALAVIETANKSKKIGKLLAGKNGILGILKEDLIDISLVINTNNEETHNVNPEKEFRYCGNSFISYNAVARKMIGLIKIKS